MPTPFHIYIGGKPNPTVDSLGGSGGGGGPLAEVTDITFSQAAGTVNILGIVPNYVAGDPATPGVSYLINNDTTTLNGGYVLVDSGSGIAAFWFNDNGTATAPAAGDFQIEVDYASGTFGTTDYIAQAIVDAANNSGYFSAYSDGYSTAYLQNTTNGTISPPDNFCGASMDCGVYDGGSNGGSANILGGEYFTVTTPSISGTTTVPTTVTFYFQPDGAGSAPGINTDEIPMTFDTSSSDVANQICNSINSNMIDNLFHATIADPGNSQFFLWSNTVGAASYNDGTSGGFNFIGTNQPGVAQPYPGYITFDTPTTLYGVWFQVGTMNSAPSLPGRTIVKVSVNEADSTNVIASAFKAAMNGVAAKTYLVSDFSGNINKKTLTNNATGAVTDATKTISAVSLTVSTQGR